MKLANETRLSWAEGRHIFGTSDGRHYARVTLGPRCERLWCGLCSVDGWQFSHVVWWCCTHYTGAQLLYVCLFQTCTSISVLNADRVAPSRSRTSGCTGTVLNRVPCAVLVIRAVISVPTAEGLSVALWSCSLMSRLASIVWYERKAPQFRQLLSLSLSFFFLYTFWNSKIPPHYYLCRALDNRPNVWNTPRDCTSAERSLSNFQSTNSLYYATFPPSLLCYKSEWHYCMESSFSIWDYDIANVTFHISAK